MMDRCSASNLMLGYCSLSEATDKRNAEKLTLAFDNNFMFMRVVRCTRVFSIACSSRYSFNLVLFDQTRLFFAYRAYV